MSQKKPQKSPKTADRTAILNDLRIVTVAVPGWGSTRLREMGLKQRMEFGSFVKDHEDPADIAGYLVSVSVVDENGALIFTEQDVPALAERNKDALDFVVAEIFALNRMGEAEKN